MKTLNINTAKLIRSFGKTSLLIMLLGVLASYIRANYDVQFIFRSVNMFDLNHENNIPTWYASLGFITCSLGAFLISRVPDQLKQAFQWKSLSFIFIFMSLDETASLHEYGASLLQGQYEFSGYWHFAWVVPAVFLIFAGAVYYFRFWLQLPARYRNTLAIGAVIFFSGSVGMEILGGKLIENSSYTSPAYLMLTLLEEIMELSGLWLFQYSIFNLLAAFQFNQTLVAETESKQFETISAKFSANGTNFPIPKSY